VETPPSLKQVKTLKVGKLPQRKVIEVHGLIRLVLVALLLLKEVNGQHLQVLIAIRTTQVLIVLLLLMDSNVLLLRMEVNLQVDIDHLHYQVVQTALVHQMLTRGGEDHFIRTEVNFNKSRK
jgi:hypothetical protein